MNSKYLTTVNLDPFLKGAIGVNSHFAEMLNLCENANHGNYPPYNIIQISETEYEIEVAVAGFKKDEINVTVENGQLTIKGTRYSINADDSDRTFLHHGISSRSFERNFALAEHVEVMVASVDDGILTVALEQILPEALQPKKIEIK